MSKYDEERIKIGVKYSDQQYTIEKSTLGESPYNKLIEDIEGVVKDKTESIFIQGPNGAISYL